MGAGHTHMYIYRGLQILIQARQEEPRNEWVVAFVVREPAGATLFRQDGRAGYASLALADHAGMTLDEEFADEWVDREARAGSSRPVP